jgi:RNA-binding protein
VSVQCSHGARPLLTRAPVTLSVKQRQFLRGLAHSLKPLVQVGSKGIGDTVIEQIKTQLLAHELIKVRFNTESAVEPDEVAADLVSRTQCELVQRTGRILVLYRRHDEKPKIVLPKAAHP